AKLTAKDLDAIARGLRNEDDTEALQAIQALLAAPRQAAAFVKGRLKPIAPVDEKEAARLIGDLASNTFQVRDKAYRALGKFGDGIKPDLLKAMEKSASLEVQAHERL